MCSGTPEPARGGHKYALRHRTAAFEMLLRYVQPLPDGYFCRNVVRVAVRTLLDDVPDWVVAMIWADLAPQLPDCHPGVNCC